MRTLQRSHPHGRAEVAGDRRATATHAGSPSSRTADAQADRADAQADRAAWQAESRQLRDEARADREHFQRQLEVLRR